MSEIKVNSVVNATGDNDTGIDLATNDQILLKVANVTRLTMNSTGQTTIVGEGGTTTTSIQQGLAKAWVHFNGTGTIAIQDSLNVTSLIDHGTGGYTTTIANDFGNANYSFIGGGTSATDGRSFVNSPKTDGDIAVGSIRTVCAENGGSGNDTVDSSNVLQAMFGDLA